MMISAEVDVGLSSITSRANNFGLLGYDVIASLPVFGCDGGCTRSTTSMEGVMGSVADQPKQARPFDLDAGRANLKPKEQEKGGLILKKDSKASNRAKGKVPAHSEVWMELLASLGGPEVFIFSTYT